MTEVSARTEKPSARPRVVDSGSRNGVHVPALVSQLLAEFAGEHDGAAGVVLDVRHGNLRCLVVREARAILSPRELEIASMVAQGHPSKRIAHTLEISGFTVNSHLRRIFMKLGVTSRPAMVAQLTHYGLVDLAGSTQEDEPEPEWEADEA